MALLTYSYLAACKIFMQHLWNSVAQQCKDSFLLANSLWVQVIIQTWHWNTISVKLQQGGENQSSSQHFSALDLFLHVMAQVSFRGLGLNHPWEYLCTGDLWAPPDGFAHFLTAIIPENKPWFLSSWGQCHLNSVCAMLSYSSIKFPVKLCGM